MSSLPESTRWTTTACPAESLDFTALLKIWTRWIPEHESIDGYRPIELCFVHPIDNRFAWEASAARQGWAGDTNKSLRIAALFEEHGYKRRLTILRTQDDRWVTVKFGSHCNFIFQGHATDADLIDWLQEYERRIIG